eukprot:5139183-Alexandrium_andersonii.AAC.1
MRRVSLTCPCRRHSAMGRGQIAQGRKDRMTESAMGRGQARQKGGSLRRVYLARPRRRHVHRPPD